MRTVLCLFSAVLFSLGSASAETPAVGLTLNVLTGSFQPTAHSVSSLPTLPIPLLNLRVPLKQFALVAEGMPPIGPVSYTSAGVRQATRLSYFSSELTWRAPNGRFEIGAGSTVFNQITYYQERFVQAQSSRVAGFRVSLQARLENNPRAVTDLKIALTPSMHGVQDTRTTFGSHFFDPEVASLTDVALERTHVHPHFDFSYGVRYMNYVAGFAATGTSGDHERVIMPFIGMAFRP